ncbi:hypothetical protein TREES_T100005573 [Tupaia chinensis]|uniref:Uncharacterized protein n=1 Tax=Tupaia chinensis TaxID=246437 RepID=L9JF26_TUPCH|nr:hypothetical protein TREES_T100005573 [Tupaia chinensis]
MGMWPHMGGLIPGAGPTAIIPGGRRPISGIMGGAPPYEVLASWQGEEDLGDWDEVGSSLLQEEEQRMEWETPPRPLPLRCEIHTGLSESEPRPPRPSAVQPLTNRHQSARGARVESRGGNMSEAGEATTTTTTLPQAPAARHGPPGPRVQEPSRLRRAPGHNPSARRPRHRKPPWGRSPSSHGHRSPHLFSHRQQRRHGEKSSHHQSPCHC